MLAQELLRQPKMSNHARGLWGYSGETQNGDPLTIQATGMGGPSASVVLADLAELGVRRAVRIGTCTALDDRPELGELVIVGEAHYLGNTEEAVLPDPTLTDALERRLGEAARRTAVASLNTLHLSGAEARPPAGEVADMQTAALLRKGEKLNVPVAAVLLVTEDSSGRLLDDEGTEKAGKQAGRVVSALFST